VGHKATTKSKEWQALPPGSASKPRWFSTGYRMPAKMQVILARTPSERSGASGRRKFCTCRWKL